MKVKLLELVYFILGVICLGLAYIGILLPGVPAIPFILLAAWFFLQSSERLHTYMSESRLFGKVMVKYGSKASRPKYFSWFVISQLWVSLIIAQLIFLHQTIHFVVINVAGVLVSFIIYKLLKR